MGSVTEPGVRAMEMRVLTRLGGWQPSLTGPKQHTTNQTHAPQASEAAIRPAHTYPVPPKSSGHMSAVVDLPHTQGSGLVVVG